MKHTRIALALITMLFAAGCTLSDAGYRRLSGHYTTLVKDEAYRPPPGQYGVVPMVGYDCYRASRPPQIAAILIDAKKMCPQTAQVERYECVDHSGKMVRWDRCEDSGAPLLLWNIPFPYGTTGTAQGRAFDDAIAMSFREPPEKGRSDPDE